MNFLWFKIELSEEHKEPCFAATRMSEHPFLIATLR